MTSIPVPRRRSVSVRGAHRVIGARTPAHAVATLDEVEVAVVSRSANLSAVVPPEGSPWWPRVLLAVSAIAIAVSWGVVHSRGLVGLNGDEAAHLLHARRVLDSVSPGFGQVGQYWPPLFQLAELPFARFGYLYRTGWAGTIPAGLFYLAAVGSAYRLGVELTRDRRAGALAGLVLAANPNMLYLGSIPMMETSIVASVTWAAATLVRSARTLRFGDLCVAGACAGIACFATYGAWGLLAYGPACLAVAARRQGYPWSRVRFICVTYAAFVAYACALWLLWGYFIQHNPFYFLQLASAGGANSLPGSLAGRPRNLLFAIVNYGSAVVDVFGPVPTALAAGLIVVAFVRRKFVTPAGAALAAGGLAIATLMWSGAIGSPTYDALTHIKDPLASYLNVRYGLWLGPFVAAAVAVVVGRSRVRQITVAACLGVGLLWFAIPVMRTVTIPPASQRGAVVRTESFGKIFDSYYKSGKVLTFSPGAGDSIIWRTGLPAADFITEFNPKQFAAAVAYPRGSVRYAFIEPSASVSITLLQTRLGREGFSLIYNHQGYQLWEAK
jgi:hypothetical protein